MNHKQKVFGIGFHKTGTSSLALALKILGYDFNRGLDDLRHVWGLERCVKLLEEQNYKPYLDYLKDFDATLDNPWYLLYKELDKAYPNSKFILTYRAEEKWIASCTHFFEGTDNIFRNWMYGTSQVHGNEQIYLDRYRSHITEVKNYFANRPDDLLLANWETGTGWVELCTFLEKPLLDLPFPHLNRKGDELHPKRST